MPNFLVGQLVVEYNCFVGIFFNANPFLPKHFNYLKLRNPHLYKMYTAYVRESPLPKTVVYKVLGTSILGIPEMFGDFLFL